MQEPSNLGDARARHPHTTRPTFTSGEPNSSVEAGTRLNKDGKVTSYRVSEFDFDAWRNSTIDAANNVVSGFEERFGFPPDEHVVGGPTSDGSMSSV